MVGMKPEQTDGSPEDVNLGTPSLRESLLQNGSGKFPEAQTVNIPVGDSSLDTPSSNSNLDSNSSSEPPPLDPADSKLETKPRKDTPLPWGSVLAVSLVLFANTLNRLIIFPFLPFMVQDFFGGELGDTEIGYYAGYLGAAFSLGGFFGNLIWGSLADRFGRRPIMLLGLFSTVFTVTAFGFSTSFIQAVGARFLWGFLNGNVGVGKTFLAEVCDDSNQAKGFAVLGMLGGVGRLIGPALGGLLTVDKASPLYKVLGNIWLFETFPYCLPTICAGGFVVISLIMCYFWLPETLENPIGCWQWMPCCGKSNVDSSNTKYQQLGSEEMRNKASISDIDDLELQKNQKGEQQSVVVVRSAQVQNGAPIESEEMKSGDEADESSIRYIFKNKNIMLSCTLYAVIAFLSNVSNEIFPLWVLTPKEEHGFDLEAHQIGLILTFIGPFQLLYQLTFPYLTKKFGYLISLQLGVLVFSFACIGFPFLGFLNNIGVVYEYILVTTGYLIMVCGRLTAFTCIFVLIANACSPSNRGTVNGIGQSMAAVARVAGPIFGGVSFAYSTTKNEAYPLNWMMDWHILSILGFLTILLARQLPKSLDKKHDKK